MLEALLVWILVAVSALFWGEKVSFGLGQWMQAATRFSGWISVWIGLVFISFLGLVLVFFTPLFPGVKLLVWLGLFAPLFYDYQWIKALYHRLKVLFLRFNGMGWTLVFFTTVLALLKTAGVPEIFDEGAYHLPLIRMWEQEGLVIGMANLNGHYGLNSAWHVLSALANLTFVPGWQTVMALNGFVVVFLGLYAASRIAQIQHNPLISYWMVAFLPALVFRNMIGSPATDVPAIVASWFVFTLWLENLEKGESPWLIWPVLVLIPLWIVMLKSSSAALLLIPFGLVLLCFQEHKWRNAGILTAIGFSLFLPWILQNWLLTGYAVFPVQSTALGSPDWQVPIQSIEKKFYLEQFGAFAPPKAYSLAWLKSWFSAHNPDTKIILILMLISVVAVFIHLVMERKKHNWTHRYFYATVLGCLLVWLLTITEPRYGFGALVFSALFPIAFVAKMLQAKVRSIHYGIGLVIVFQGFNLYKTWGEFRPDKTGIWQPAYRPKVAYRSLQCANFEAATPLYYLTEVPKGKPPFCWDCPFPCVPKEGKMDSLHLYQTERLWKKAFVFRP